ncbi:unnamed protein product [Paramecium octaurelia]|uniref:Uncharacterized protein n=1 Tax=Paramecium octaurelia TaxID=43137 RepID=A0A8S1XGD3_PAROT|nr:unnamed protein product [Paramecium octaurelia]
MDSRQELFQFINLLLQSQAKYLFSSCQLLIVKASTKDELQTIGRMEAINNINPKKSTEVKHI